MLRHAQTISGRTPKELVTGVVSGDTWWVLWDKRQMLLPLYYVHMLTTQQT